MGCRAPRIEFQETIISEEYDEDMFNPAEEEFMPALHDGAVVLAPALTEKATGIDNTTILDGSTTRSQVSRTAVSGAIGTDTQYDVPEKMSGVAAAAPAAGGGVMPRSKPCLVLMYPSWVSIELRCQISKLIVRL